MIRRRFQSVRVPCFLLPLVDYSLMAYPLDAVPDLIVAGDADNWQPSAVGQDPGVGSEAIL